MKNFSVLPRYLQRIPVESYYLNNGHAYMLAVSTLNINNSKKRQNDLYNKLFSFRAMYC